MPQTPEEKRSWIRDRMEFANTRLWLQRIDHSGFKSLLRRLDDLHVEIGYDTGLSPREAHEQPRLGLTLVVPDFPPLIWLNSIKLRNRGEAELVDTIVHESVHATAPFLNRHARLPDDQNSAEYNAEEIVARHGANLILRRIRYPAPDQIRTNEHVIAQHKELLRDRFRYRRLQFTNLEEQAARAVEFLQLER